MNKQHDIALLKLVSEANMTKNNVKTICLPTAPNINFEEVKKSKFSIAGRI